MSNKVAIWIAVLALLAIAVDNFYYGGSGIFFLMRKFIDLIDYFQFWR
ncbi:hypothetical protein HCZ30_12945 [Marivivens donghaensis]|uniref:Glyceraldehyde-3-phosphate dehydrogenase n=1 Tax=Marivivens donghaensis TaxID=1699413 RepID=A0ABX0VZZ3_9RHOB|nr:MULTISPECIES: hypothetical protein [Marivivens]NIY73335.1 hypothetical protein [Marivivens donghaensis]